MQRFHDPRIDSDHDLVITQFEALCHLTCWEEAGLAENLTLLRQLQEYVADHARREEAIMAKAAFPGLRAHAAAHARLAQAFQRLAGPMLDATFSVERELGLLRRLFLAHIVTWDEAFGTWLAVQETRRRMPRLRRTARRCLWTVRPAAS